MNSTTDCPADALLKGQRVALVGKLAGMSRREAQQLVRKHGGTVVERPDEQTTLVVVGENEVPLGHDAAGEASLDGVSLEHALDATVRAAVDRGTLEVVGETQLWQRLGLVDREQHIRRLYTPAMLAQLLGVSAATIRRWHRRGWIVPVREVRRLAYFDFQEVATARRLTELLAAGLSAATIEKRLAALARYLPDVRRPLAQLSIIVEGKELLLRQGSALREPGGQFRFDFSAHEEHRPSEGGTAPVEGEAQQRATILRMPLAEPQATPAEMVQWAGQLEDEGQTAAAAEMYRAALAAGGPHAETCFLLAELLYQMHDLAAARERYYMAIELDENFVEARANLGCVLADLGEKELAVSAFEGALLYHDSYPDAHYQLARLLDEMGRAPEAAAHWEAFLRLAPTSPWADEARERLGS